MIDPTPLGLAFMSGWMGRSLLAPGGDRWVNLLCLASCLGCAALAIGWYIP